MIAELVPDEPATGVYFAWLVGALTVFLSGYIIYQTTLHPLACYPGPFLAKLTSLYSVYHAIKGTRHETLYELHRKYGTFIRYGPNHVSINDASAVEQIYGHQANVKKGSWYNVYYSTSIFNVTDKDVHARKKRVMSQAFSDRAVRGMESHIISAIQEWCKCLGADSTYKEWSKPKDMTKWSAYMIFDVLGEICFGETFGTASRGDNRFFLDLMTEHVRFLNIIGQMRILNRLNLAKIFLRKSRQLRQKQIVFSHKQLQKRLSIDASKMGRRDIIYYLQQARDPETGEGYSEKELMGETVLLLGAGSDTANSALTTIFYFLLQHPDIQQRLTSSIRSTFSRVDDIVSGPVLQSLSYLRVCIEECMRLCPPIPMPLPREVLEGGIEICGRFFEPGCTVAAPTYALHHSEKHFREPFKYDPLRWLVEGTEGVAAGEGRTKEEVQTAREAYIPFSIGPRACIGRSVALLELQIGVARVLWLYDIRLAPGYEDLGVGKQGEYKMKDFFIVGKEGPVMQLRKAAHA